MRFIVLATLLLSTSAALADDFKVVDVADLGVGSRKYVGKNIEVRNVHCYYADTNDYRCTAGGGVAIFIKSIGSLASRNWVETNCDALKIAMTSNKCVMTLLFNYSADDVDQDVVSGYVRRTIISPASVTILTPEDRRKP